jgi:hypothetical protein
MLAVEKPTLEQLAKRKAIQYGAVPTLQEPTNQPPTLLPALSTAILAHMFRLSRDASRLRICSSFPFCLDVTRLRISSPLCLFHRGSSRDDSTTDWAANITAQYA